MKTKVVNALYFLLGFAFALALVFTIQAVSDYKIKKEILKTDPEFCTKSIKDEKA